MSNPKEIVTTLDIAAQRAGAAGASSKQTWFLAKLLAEREEPAEGVVTSGLLTKKQASFYIDQMLRERAA